MYTLLEGDILFIYLFIYIFLMYLEGIIINFKTD